MAKSKEERMRVAVEELIHRAVWMSYFVDKSIGGEDAREVFGIALKRLEKIENE